MSGRPSYYLQELNSIAARVGVSEDLVRHQFEQALPPAISPVLAAQRELTLQQLGTLADELSPQLNNQIMLVSGQPTRRSQSPRSSRQPHSCQSAYSDGGEFFFFFLLINAPRSAVGISTSLKSQGPANHGADGRTRRVARFNLTHERRHPRLPEHLRNSR
jgi:hypothetical protein